MRSAELTFANRTADGSRQSTSGTRSPGRTVVRRTNAVRQTSASQQTVPRLMGYKSATTLYMAEIGKRR